MLRCIECDGVPRDLGQEQGRALSREIRLAGSAARPGRLARVLSALRQEAGAARDLERYFPHLAERAAGMAEGAGVGRAALLARCVAPAWHALAVSHSGVGCGLRAEPGGAGPCLAASLPLAQAGDAVLRRVRPQAGIESLELGLAWWVGAFAGVNAGGLAALALPAEASAPAPGGGAAVPSGCAAPAALFVTQCLERFERVGAALEWCLRRPAAGPAALLFADAGGDLAGLLVQPAGRRVVRDEGGLLLLGAPEARRARLEKDARRSGRLSPSGLATLLAPASGPATASEIAVALLPGARRLGLVRAGGGEDLDWRCA